LGLAICYTARELEENAFRTAYICIKIGGYIMEYFDELKVKSEIYQADNRLRYEHNPIERLLLISEGLALKDMLREEVIQR